MSRILFVWEQGGTYGRLAPLPALAGELAARGHQVAIAARELHNVATVMEGARAELYQSPVWLPAIRGLPEPPLNYAEALLRHGYHDAHCLSGLVKAWLGLFNNFWPNVVVCSHAPTAMLAARVARLPVVAMGDGYAIPPRLAPMPNLCTWLEVPEGRLQGSEQIVLETANQILGSLSAPRLGALYELFDVAENILCTFPELDPYGERADTRYWGAAYRADLGEAVEWPSGADKRVFAYIKPESRDFAAIISALAGLGVSAIVSVPGISENDRQRLSTGKVKIYPRLARLDGIVRDCDLFIGGAGTATTAAMLLGGVPCVLLVDNLEQFLLARRAAATGAAVFTNPEAPPPDYRQMLSKALGSAELSRQAGQFAAAHAGFDPLAQRNEIADRIATIAGAR